jgi:hypothetical protein
MDSAPDPVLTAAQHNALALAHNAAVAMAGAAHAADALAEGLGGPARASAATVAAEQLSGWLSAFGQQFLAYVDAHNDIHRAAHNIRRTAHDDPLPAPDADELADPLDDRLGDHDRVEHLDDRADDAGAYEHF